MKKIFNKYILIFIILLISIVFFNHSKVDAISYKNDFIKLEETTTLETDDFEMNLQYTGFSNGILEKLATITEYDKRKTNETNSQYSSNINSNNYTYSSNSYDYIINNYNIDMVVNENNSFDITETITAYFNVPKHGIFRKIPLRNSITRLDGTKSNNTAQISNISVNENYTTSNEGKYKVIKIGDSNKTLTGSHTYTIKYTYDIGKDPLKDLDELYYNLIGDQWDTIINKVSFTIKMPKAFDKSTLGFSSENIGFTDSSNVTYNVNENIITGSTINALSSGQALTVRLTLPEGYFTGESLNIDAYSVAVIIICLICVLIADRIWVKYGKDDEVIETVEFYPPEGYNSAEVGFLYKGSADTESIISLLIYLANKGYLKIEETEEQGLFKKSKGFKIIKIKEYDGNNECEKLFFNGLFKESGKSIVTASDLYNNFYITLNRIEAKLNSKENKSKIFESCTSGKGKWLILMIMAIVILITTKPVLEYSGIKQLLSSWLFLAEVLLILSESLMGAIKHKLIWIILSVLSLVIFIYRVTLIQNPMYLIMSIVGIISIVVIVLFIKIMPKRTPYGNEILGKLRGFKRFLEIAEKSQLESLVTQNPEYFYNILPYTYALGVSDVWIRQFETIALQAPNWYVSNDEFNVYSFRMFMNTTMISASSAMSSSPSSNSGGGSSGGGSGGGGGGSW